MKKASDYKERSGVCSKEKTVPRVLVFGMTENPGGVESFLISYYRHFDKSRIQLDFLCNSYNPVAYEDELLGLGARTFHITARSSNHFIYRKELENLFSEHSGEWSAVWVNVSSLANIDYLKAAKKHGIKKRVIHSHNSRNMDGTLRGFLHYLNKNRLEKYATDFWACSEDAAKWFYKEKLLPEVRLVNNAIDVKVMAFDKEKRQNLRVELGISETQFVIGNVGRLHFQKNQKFALAVFAEVIKKCPDSVLIFVGQGEDEETLKQLCLDHGISDRVIFAGVQNNMQAWFSAFDLFLFPSLFEGLSIAALEAQANGLPALASYGVIPEDIRINSNFEFMSLDKDLSIWAEKICSLKDNCTRPAFEQVFANFVEKGFEIGTQAKRLEKLLVKKNQ